MFLRWLPAAFGSVPGKELVYILPRAGISGCRCSGAATVLCQSWRGHSCLQRRDSSVRPKGADYQWGEDPLEQLLVRFDSWRAVRSGNGSGWSLATKSTFGGRATLQAVTRVKLEQASKVTMWTPTRQMSGEGRLD